MVFPVASVACLTADGPTVYRSICIRWTSCAHSDAPYRHTHHIADIWMALLQDSHHNRPSSNLQALPQPSVISTIRVPASGCRCRASPGTGHGNPVPYQTRTRLLTGQLGRPARQTDRQTDSRQTAVSRNQAELLRKGEGSCEASRTSNLHSGRKPFPSERTKKSE